jgi:hypothetical protein
VVLIWWKDGRALFQSGYDEAARPRFGCFAILMDTRLWTYGSLRWCQWGATVLVLLLTVGESKRRRVASEFGMRSVAGKERGVVSSIFCCLAVVCCSAYSSPGANLPSSQSSESSHLGKIIPVENLTQEQVHDATSLKPDGTRSCERPKPHISLHLTHTGHHPHLHLHAHAPRGTHLYL